MPGNLCAFVDPTPVTAERLSDDEMALQLGGVPVLLVIVIIECGGSLGTATIVTTGAAIVHIAD